MITYNTLVERLEHVLAELDDITPITASNVRSLENIRYAIEKLITSNKPLWSGGDYTIKQAQNNEKKGN